MSTSKVDDDDQNGAGEDDAEQQRRVARGHRFLRQPAEAGHGKDAFDDDAAAQHLRRLQAEHGDQRQQRVAGDMGEHDAAARQSPGAGGEDKILPPGLGHAGAHHAQIEREIDEAERGDRQDEMGGDVGGAVEAGLVRRQALDAADRQPAQVDGEDHDQHQAEPEARHGIERQRADRQETVAKAAGSCAGIDAERRAEAEGERGGADHQEKRCGQALEDDFADRPGEGDGLAEVEMQQRPEIVGKPRQFRLVEAPAMAQQFDHAGIAAGRDDIGIDRIAGRGFEQKECADDDDQQHEDAADETAAEEGEGAGHGEKNAAREPLRLRSTAPPSVLPDISPTRGEISCYRGLRQSPR